MHVFYNPENEDWLAYFERQSGEGVFRGLMYQRGAGIGSIFRSMFRYLLPIAKTIGREVGLEGLATGSRILGEVAGGKDVKGAVVDESREGLRKLLNRASTRMNERQTGSGRRNKVVGRRVALHRDSLGTYQKL